MFSNYFLIIFFTTTNFLFGQNFDVAVFEITDVKFINEKNVSIVSSDSVLANLKISDDDKKKITSMTDFSKYQLIFLSFPFSGPSMCNQTYFEYQLKKEGQATELFILIHSIGGLAARKYKNTFLNVPKNIQISNIKIDKKYVEYIYQTKNQLDSICNNLYKKFNK